MPVSSGTPAQVPGGRSRREPGKGQSPLSPRAERSVSSPGSPRTFLDQRFAGLSMARLGWLVRRAALQLAGVGHTSSEVSKPSGG
jgi:hypothetical protein